jgi:hypothetical protein
VATVTMDVTVTTTQLVYCQTTEDPRGGGGGGGGGGGNASRPGVDPSFINARECTLVYLSDIAPVLSFFRSGGAVALAFLLLGLAAAAPAAYLTYLRALGASWRVPERLAPFRSPFAPPALHAVAAVMTTVAWGHYAGAVVSSYSEPALRRVVLFDDLFAVLTFAPPALSGGFGAAVAGWILSVVAAVLTGVFREEVARTGLGGGGAGAGGAGGAGVDDPHTAAALTAANARAAASIGGAYGETGVADWGAGGVGAAPGAGFSAVSLSAGGTPPAPPPRPGAGGPAAAAPQFSAGGSYDAAGAGAPPPLPPKTGRGAAVLLAQGLSASAAAAVPPPPAAAALGHAALTAGAASTRMFTVPPPLPVEEGEEDEDGGERTV